MMQGETSYMPFDVLEREDVHVVKEVEKIKVRTHNSVNQKITEPLYLIVNGINGEEDIKIRKTDETPPRVSVIDLLCAVNVIDADHASKSLRRLCEQYPDVRTKCPNFQFEGRGQRPTPVTDARGAVTIINLLPGPRAAAFRAKSADIMVRYLGGDDSLVAEMQANLPPENPMAIFGQDVAERKAKEMVRLSSLVMPSNADIVSVGVPDAMRPPSCVYAFTIHVIHRSM